MAKSIIMMAFFLDDAHQHDDADEGIEIEVTAEQVQREEGAEPCGREARQHR